MLLVTLKDNFNTVEEVIEVITTDGVITQRELSDLADETATRRPIGQGQCTR
ncbi:MAG: hypothetical protein HQL03_09505 [Nitrospirae bacterium]|nr:hypothetical protein [Nitrospirota bacterium]